MGSKIIDSLQETDDDSFLQLDLSLKHYVQNLSPVPFTIPAMHISMKDV